jgi:hypothetical protein
MKTLIAVIVTGIVLTLTACGSIQIDMRDGTARIEQCPNVTFRIIVIQGPNQPSARATPNGGVVSFRSSTFRDIDFTQSVTINVFADTVPPDSNCPIRAGVRYVLENKVLTPASGTSDTYEIDLADFQERP